MSARVGSAWKKFRELNGVLVGKQGLSLKQRGKCISVVLDQFCCTVVKRGNFLLRMRQDFVGWSIASCGSCVR